MSTRFTLQASRLVRTGLSNNDKNYQGEQMNKIGYWLAGMMLAFGAAHAEPQRMQLSITRPIGMTNGDICVTTALEADKPAVRLVLTEADVSPWDATTVTWTLDPSRIAGPA